MKLESGIKLLEDVPGTGAEARRGDRGTACGPIATLLTSPFPVSDVSAFETNVLQEAGVAPGRRSTVVSLTEESARELENS